MRKLRPAVVVNLDSIGRLPLRIVVPLTDWQRTFAALPWFVPVSANAATGLAKDLARTLFRSNPSLKIALCSVLALSPVISLDEIASAIAMCVGAP
jgi:mRNA interferase MazF